jgi:hypothetical protein
MMTDWAEIDLAAGALRASWSYHLGSSLARAEKAFPVLRPSEPIAALLGCGELPVSDCEHILLPLRG